MTLGVGERDGRAGYRPARPAGGTASSRRRWCGQWQPLSSLLPPCRVELRERRCKRCGQTFGVCRLHDRGQVYCGNECRVPARLEQKRAAHRCYRASLGAEGRTDHRDAERERRARHRERVGDQSSEKLTGSALGGAREETTNAPDEVEAAATGRWRADFGVAERRVGGDGAAEQQAPVAGSAGPGWRTRSVAHSHR